MNLISYIDSGLCIKFWQYGKNVISFKIPNESPFPPSRSSSCNPFVLVSTLTVSSLYPNDSRWLLCCVVSICVFIWLVLVTLLCTVSKREFLSCGFPFLSKSTSSFVQSRLFAAWRIRCFFSSRFCFGVLLCAHRLMFRILTIIIRLLFWYFLQFLQSLNCHFNAAINACKSSSSLFFYT